MSKLDEIEAEFLGVGDIDDAHAAWWKEEYGALLIRAVRQLGRETMAWYSSRPDLATERIDPDVLELIENPIGVVASDGPENKDR